MNEQLSNTLQTDAAALIEKALSGIDQATGFLQAEIPDYVYQLLLWKGVESFITFILCLVVTGSWIFYGIVKPIKMISKDLKDREQNFFVSAHAYNNGKVEVDFSALLLLLNVFILFPLLGLINNLEWLQIWIAPEVWLVEYAATLVK